jgi:hypothetical protein
MLLAIAVSCSENKQEEIIITPPGKYDHCFNVISVATNEASCDNKLAIEVVKHYDYLYTDYRLFNRRTICINEDNFEFNDFRLGQLICDLSIYK